MENVKLYEEYAKAVLVLMNDTKFTQSLEEITQTMNEVANDDGLTDKGRQRYYTSLKNDFAKKVKEQSDAIRLVVEKFCNKYKMVAPDDGESHTSDMANILKIIDTCGFSLTPDILKTAIEPIKNSATQLRMVASILEAKNQSNTGASYSLDVTKLINQYLSIGVMGEESIAYETAFGEVESILQNENILPIKVVENWIDPSKVYIGDKRVYRIENSTPYDTFCLADNMMKVGQMFEEIYPGNERFFDR